MDGEKKNNNNNKKHKGNLYKLLKAIKQLQK